MNKKLLGILLSLMLVSPVAAATLGSSTTSPTRLNGLRELRENLKILRANLNSASSSEERKQAWDEFKIMFASTTAQFKKDIEQEREDLKERLEAERQELKDNLKKIKNGDKARTVEQIAAEFDAINARRTASFADVLNKLQEVLGKISAKADELAASGQDVSALHAAVSDAAAAISAAQSAVTTQSGKTYKIDVTTETQLKNAVGKTRSALAHDLNDVYTQVKSAREAVRDAVKALRALTGEGTNDDDSASSTVPASTSTATSS